MTFRSMALLVLSAACISKADADEVDVSTLDANVTRVSYINSPELSDGQAFTHLLGLLSSVDEETASLILRSGLEIDGEESAQLLDVMLEEYGRLHATIEAAYVARGCIAGVPRVYGDEVYPVLEAMDDEAERIGAAWLAKFLEEIGPEKSKKVMRWIRTEKTNISYVKFDYKELSKRTGYSGDVTLSTICSSLSGFQEKTRIPEEAQ
jgi:hypothetical protein